ncbi:hypothetical protein [Gulosibacter molinativorax]|uniref:MFS transporter n=1 Tax=Gulosibacter molinativorax TaxID=256821 RepID=A0ABT7C9E7_9MICO|nr:hypothetical protein [Gulosibacter molinativorax]MDJ1371828.1 hypothetical protein [Gulosibacter molinativorax]QUY60800.1 Putative membrane protein [Gulosibacter molinativorax]
MSYQEKNAWFYGSTAIVVYLVYVIVVLSLAGGAPLEQTAYQLPLLGSIGAAVVIGIIGGITLGAFSGKGDTHTDVRDREISRLGDMIGQSLVIAGAILALIFAMIELPHFWIANVIYLAFVLYAVVSSVIRIITYRRSAAE